MATVDGVCHVSLYNKHDEGRYRGLERQSANFIRFMESEKMKLEDINLKLFEMELRMGPDLTPEEKFQLYLYRRTCVTLQEMLQTIGLYRSDL